MSEADKDWDEFYSDAKALGGTEERVEIFTAHCKELRQFVDSIAIRALGAFDPKTKARLQNWIDAKVAVSMSLQRKRPSDYQVNDD